MSSVCRKNVAEESEDVRCCNCAGNHVPNSPEFEVARVRAVQQVSYMEAREIVEGASGADDMAVDALQPLEIQSVVQTVEGS